MRMLFSSPVAEVLGTPDQDVHTVAGNEAHCQQTQRAHLEEGGARGQGKKEENEFVKDTVGKDLVMQMSFKMQRTF